MAGTDITARHFPFRIGRAASAHLQLEEQGVWDQHLELTLDRTSGFSVATAPDALVTINGQPVRECVLRNGDTIEIGALKIRFWLSSVRQYGLFIRETLVWISFVALMAAQIALIYWLLPS